MKTCTKCGADKALVDFHLNTRAKDGRQSKCKLCRAHQARVRYVAKRDHIISTTRLYRESVADELRVKLRARNKDPDYRAAMNRSARRRRVEEPERFRARAAVAYAIKTGRIVRPDRCERCGEHGRVTAHHHSYARCNRLNVEWLCHRCHRRTHGGGDAT